MSVRDLRDLKNLFLQKMEEEIKNHEAENGKKKTPQTGTGAKTAPHPQQGKRIVISVSLKDLIDTFYDMQKNNPVIHKSSVLIEKITDPDGANYRIQQLFLDDRGEYIYHDAMRKRIVGKVYLSISIDDLLKSRMGDAPSLEFNL